MLFQGSMLRASINGRPDVEVSLLGIVGIGATTVLARGQLLAGDGRLVAMRFRILNSNAERVRSERELGIWRRAQHRYILPLVGTYVDRARFACITPWLPNGDIVQYLAGNPDEDRRTLLTQLAEALHYLHTELCVVHGEVKCDNVLISSAREVQLANFGSSLPANTEQDGTSSPTDNQNSPITTATDVYAFAWLLYHIYTDVDPREIARDPHMLQLVSQGTNPLRPGPHSIAALRGLDNQTWNMCTRAWELAPAKRPNISEVLDVLNGQHGNTYISVESGATLELEAGSVVRIESFSEGRADNITIVEQVASGPLSDVLKGRACAPARLLAIKVIKSSAPTRQEFLRHLVSRKDVQHVHLLPVLGACEVGGRLLIASPWVANGNLLQHVFRNPQVDRRALVLQTAVALDYLHTEVGLVHGDLKCENVLISDAGTALLADFGLSSVIDNAVQDVKAVANLRAQGTFMFAAPEIHVDPFQGSAAARIVRKTRATDVYAYGILVFEAYSGRGPWAVLRESLMQGFPPSRPRAGSSAVARGLDDGMWDMCTRCWALDPVNRPSMRDVVRAYDGHAFPSPAATARVFDPPVWRRSCRDANFMQGRFCRSGESACMKLIKDKPGGPVGGGLPRAPSVLNGEHCRFKRSASEDCDGLGNSSASPPTKRQRL